LGLAATLSSVVLVWCACALALDPSLDIRQYAHTAWRVRDGFTKGIITSLAQTPDGYLWVGTESGLLRFDGVRPVVWQPPSNQQLPGTLITNLLTARDGTLWIGTFSGLANWKDGTFRQVPELAGQSVTSVLEARDGTVWVGVYANSGGGTLCDIHHEVVHCERKSDKLGPGVKALYEDSRGALWLGLEKGFWRWNPGTPEFFSTPNEPFGIVSFAEDEQGYLLFGSHDGIRRLINGHTEPYPSTAAAYRWQVTKMFRDHDGGLWVGTSEHGLVHIHDGRTDDLSNLDGLSGDYVTRFFEDREGSVWVATFDGLDRFRAYAVPTISGKEGLSSTTAMSVLAAKDGSVWIATFNGLNHWEKGRISLFGSAGGKQKSDGKLNGRWPLALFQESRGRIWVATNGELGYLDNDRFVPIRGIPGGVVYSIAEVPSGHLWVANQQAGLFHLFDGRLQQQIPWVRLGRKDFAKTIVADPSHRGLWLGFQGGGVIYFADGTIRASYSSESGLAGEVTDLRFGARGALWVATASGLSRIKDGSVTTLTRKNGLPCDMVVATMEDSDHSMWLYLACGLVRITRAELDAWVANPNRVLNTTLFEASDGVRGHVSSGGVQPLMTKTADGRIWFNPWDGVSVIDPHHIPFNKIPPPVHVEQITADGKIYDPSKALRLPPHVRDLTIDYTALSFIAPEKIHFRYKLEGQDPDWREVVNDHHVQYSNLAPRHYTFRVMACNNSGVWNEAGATLDLVIPPAWYQTNWFRAACAVVFLAMLWGMYELRVRQLAAQFNMRLDERVNERTRIARELHDTLLQNFQGLLPRLQAALNLYTSPERVTEARKTLEAAIDTASEAITEGRNAVKGMRLSFVEKNDLAVAVRTLGEELAVATDSQSSPTFEVAVEGTPRSLHPILRDEVYRLVVEALRNAFRHAQAGKIEVEIRYGEREFRLQVRDNGRGIDPSVLSGGGREGHYGLHGMHERAKIAGGKLTIWSELGSGTEIELSIPAVRAYTQPPRRLRLLQKLSRKDKDRQEKVEL